MTKKDIERKQAERKAKRTTRKARKEDIKNITIGVVFGLIMVAIFYYGTC